MTCRIELKPPGNAMTGIFLQKAERGHRNISKEITFFSAAARQVT